MGIRTFGSHENKGNAGSHVTHVHVTNQIMPPTSPNPNPRNFKIENYSAFGDFLVVEITYPDATNFEGVKILVFQGISIKQLKQFKEIDPHFADNGKLAPIARFVPTNDGWYWATQFAAMAQKNRGG